VLLILGTNKQPFEPKHTNTQRGNLHGLLPVLHRSDWWLAPVRPVTPVKPVDRAGQAGGYNSRATNVSESLCDFSRPWNQNTSKTQPARKKNSPQSQAKQLQADQELTSNNTTPKHTNSETHSRQIPQRLTPVRPVKSTGQTGLWAARDELNVRVNSSKSKL
jgi:hypothetical protein